MTFEIPGSEPGSEEVARECTRAAENAVEWVRSMSGIELDFSPPSLMVLDRVLTQLIPTMSDDEQDSTVILLGSYLGEVMIRAMGGRWETGDVFTGPTLRGLQGRDITISPFSQIRLAFSKVEANHTASFWNTIVHRLKDTTELLDDSIPIKKVNTSARLLPIEGQSSGAGFAISDDEIADSIQKETERFINILKADLGFELDYSIDSLQFIDHYLVTLSDKIKKGGSSDVRVQVYLVGNYIGEVLKRNFGGRWFFNRENQTAGLFLFDAAETENTIYPHAIVAKFALEYQDGALNKYIKKIQDKLVSSKK